MDRVSGQGVRYQGVTCECPSLARRWRDTDRPTDHAEHHPVFPEQEPHEQETCRPYQGSEDHHHIHGLWLNWHRTAASRYPAAQEPTGSPGNAPLGIAADQPEEHTGNRQNRHSADHHADNLDAPSLSQPPNHADHGSEEEPGEKHAEDSAIACKKQYVVDSYRDQAVGILEKDGSGRLAIVRVTLRPQVRFGGEKTPTPEELAQMHGQAHHACFIANSVKTEVVIEPL
jgi:hypothetical protein